MGNSLIDSGSYILHAIDRPDLTPEWVVDQLVSQVIQHLRTGNLPWRPGALDLLARSRAAGIPCALVSASYRVQLDAAIAALPPGSFATSVAGDEVQRGKPHPEPYERACAELGVDPRRCVVFEDSETGARSGNAAGALVVAVPNRVPIPDAPGGSSWPRWPTWTSPTWPACWTRPMRASRTGARRALAAVLALAVVGLSACDSPTEPPAPTTPGRPRARSR